MSNYTIDVNFKSEEDGYKSPLSSPNPNNPVDDDYSFGALVKGVRGFAQAIPGAQIVKGTFDWGVSLIGRETGSQYAQDKANAILKIIGQTGGIAMSFAVGGPVGGLTAIAATALSYAREAEQTNYDRNVENINRRLLRERAGASFNRSREGR